MSNAVLHRIPRLVHLGQRELAEFLALLAEVRFHRVEAADELVIGGGESGLGFDAEFAGEIDDAEEQIADFFLDVRFVAGLCTASSSSAVFLADLIEDGRGVRPVEADARGLLLQLLRRASAPAGRCPRRGACLRAACPFRCA
jgi:hypothetical protein